MRDLHWPWGFPWAEGEDLARAAAGNRRLLAVVQLLEAGAYACQRGASVRMVFMHPEDLGEALLGDPASPWALPQIQALTGAGLQRGAAHLCRLAGTDRPSPTGFLCNVPVWLAKLTLGWPTFRAGRLPDGRGTTRAYSGPFPRSCGHETHGPAGRLPDQPDALDTGLRGEGRLYDLLAAAVISDFAARTTPPTTPLKDGQLDGVGGDEQALEKKAWSPGAERALEEKAQSPEADKGRESPTRSVTLEALGEKAKGTTRAVTLEALEEEAEAPSHREKRHQQMRLATWTSGGLRVDIPPLPNSQRAEGVPESSRGARRLEVHQWPARWAQGRPTSAVGTDGTGSRSGATPSRSRMEEGPWP